ncbi:cardiolipin synthase [Alsobacter sp. KACC 23698]|uniref:Cardiolipin synthase n=1 Tax=Alsobacter sp. KACC 23698 TaxID=3149229 RepID=A0AAU7JN13_9HYPH
MGGSWLGVAAALAHVVIVIAALVVVPGDRKPSSATAWLLLITGAPFLGLALFLMIGDPRLPRRRRELQARMGEAIAASLAALPPERLALFDPEVPARDRRHVELARSLGGMPATGGNRLDLLWGYDGIVARMVEAIDAATRYVHVEFYIVALDETTEPLFAALERAVGRGVRVRLLFDQIGSRKFPRKREMRERLTRAGVEWRAMLPILGVREWLRFDLRNHRKLLVIDAAVAFTGSMNLIERGYHRADGLTYEELCVRIEGPAVLELDAVFTVDWLSESEGKPGEIAAAASPGTAAAPGAVAQVLPSGSGFDDENNLRLFTALAHAARRSLTIVTPYFVPDEALMLAITSAARRGVAVTLVNSEAVDQAVVVAAQRSFYEELLRDGVEIRLYRAPVLLHAKSVVVDDEIATIGSSNLDIRSFTLNMEVTLVVYDRAFVDRLREVIGGYVANASRVTLEEWRRRPVRKRLVENIARLTAALQ